MAVRILAALTGFGRALFGRQLYRLRSLLSPRLRRPDLLTSDQLEPGLDVVYRFLLARRIDESGRQHYLRLMREDGMRLREVAAEIAGSDEFQERVKRRLAGRVIQQPHVSRPDGFVDARELMQALSVTELAGTAEEYYRRTVGRADYYHAKPLADLHDAADLLCFFGHLLGGLRLLPSMVVLDFGAGTCWTTRFLTQLGCAVIALDVSPTALSLGKDLFARLPPVGIRPEPRFLLFNGRRIDLPDGSVDRIVCFDAFHHVPNPAEVLAELARVLRPGGIAGFSEPGPEHSKAATAQFEMKNFTALENDVVMADIWRWARCAGFTGLEMAIFSTESCRVPLEDFHDLIAGGAPLDVYGEKLRDFLTGHQTFFLRKGEVSLDSRDRRGLKGEIAVTLHKTDVPASELLRGQATVRNVGDAAWLPGRTTVGGVNLGVHLQSRDGRPLDLDFGRVILESGTAPRGAETIDFALTPPPPGEYLLEFDLVSEGIGWFEASGSRTAIVPIIVRRD